MVVCVPVNVDGSIDPRWGRADRVAIVRTTAQEITGWEEIEVGWSTLHDTGGEGAHHARVARLLIDYGVEAVVADHMGGGMLHMLGRMGISLHLGAAGDARKAVVAALADQPG